MTSPARYWRSSLKQVAEGAARKIQPRTLDHGDLVDALKAPLVERLFGALAPEGVALAPCHANTGIIEGIRSDDGRREVFAIEGGEKGEDARARIHEDLRVWAGA